MDIAAIIFSLDERIIPFPYWRAAERERGSTHRSGRGRRPALIVPLDRRTGAPPTNGRGPGPSAA